MSNNYFQFKQFRINQDRCSMKVCTDACIFGAWVAKEGMDLPAAAVLDIGSGTGLLSLMYAQKNPGAKIEAVEIESNAFEEGSENFSSSPWKDRLQMIHADIREHDPGKKYDLIYSNPPFYENELLSPEINKNIARHDHGLKFHGLITKVNSLLEHDGKFAVLLPAHRVSYFEELASGSGFFLHKKIMVRQTHSHDFFRGMLLLGKVEYPIVKGKIIIKKKEGNYTEEFKELLVDYYLKL